MSTSPPDDGVDTSTPAHRRPEVGQSYSDDESDPDEYSLSDSSESFIMPYTKDDIQLPPHPKKIKFVDEANNAETSLVTDTRLIPGGRLGRHFWYLEDVPEGSSFRTGPETTSNSKDRRKRRQRRNRKKQLRKLENAAGNKVGDSPPRAPALSAPLPPPLSSAVPPEVTPDDCVEPISPEPIIAEIPGDESGAESDVSGGSGWGASRALSDVEDDSMNQDEADDNNDGGEPDVEVEGKADICNDDSDYMEDDTDHYEEDERGQDDDMEDDIMDDEDEDEGDLAAGQQIEHSIQNMDGFQKEKLVEAMMNDILKSMRAIEKQKRADADADADAGAEEEQQKQLQQGNISPSGSGSSPPSSPVTGTMIEVNKSEECKAGPVTGGFGSWEAFSESCNAFNFDPNIIYDGDEPNEDTNNSSATKDDSDFFVDLLTNESVDEFVRAQAVEWMDDAQKDDEEEDDDDEEDVDEANFDEFFDNDSNNKISGNGHDYYVGHLGPPTTATCDPLVMKHSFLDAESPPREVEIQGMTSRSTASDERAARPGVEVVQFQVPRSPPRRPPVRQLSKKKSKKKKKKSFAKKMFKLSLEGEIEETKRRKEERRIRISHNSNSD